MSHSQKLIKNGQLINENQIIKADILIEGNRIKKIAEQINSDASTGIYDADVNYVIPGLIDDQVHF